MRLNRSTRLCPFPPRRRRSGLTFLEVVISLAIFLFSLTAISQLMSMASQNVLEANLRNEGALICQSVMAEVTSGAVDGGGGSGSELGWDWTVDSSPNDDLPNLNNVTVRVTRKMSGREPLELSLSQIVLNPAMRGSTSDTPIQPPDEAATPATPTPSGGS